MKKQENNTTEAYALYTYISMETDAKFGATPNTYSESYPNPITKYKASNYLISYAIKRYFNIDIQEEKPMRYIKNGRGYIHRIYFSTSVCLRVICVCVSNNPVGISNQIHFSINDELEYAMHSFCKNELEEYKMKKFGEDTYYYLNAQKHAYQKKHKLIYVEDLKTVDSTQDSYTYYRDTFFDEPFYFVATGNVEFERVDDAEILQSKE
ncbi:MAG: hypothetical protein K2J85_04765 [Anaeroplasmataceae bacterium]|nr:hypothetical protein [Anaeroplasmataceae bacterium]